MIQGININNVIKDEVVVNKINFKLFLLLFLVLHLTSSIV